MCYRDFAKTNTRTSYKRFLGYFKRMFKSVMFLYYAVQILRDINQSNDNDILNLDTPVKLSTVSGTKGPGIQVQRKPTILIQNVMFFMPDSRSHVAMKEWPSAGLPVRYDKLIDRR